MFVFSCGCATAKQESRTPPLEPVCAKQQEIDDHAQKAAELGHAGSEARELGREAELALEAAVTEEARAAAQRELEQAQMDEGFYFGQSDVHYFAAERLRDECLRGAVEN